MLLSRGLAAAMAAVLLASAPEASAERRPAPALRSIAPEKAGFDRARLEKLDAALQQAVTDGRIAGAVTMLGRRGRIVDVNVVGRRSLAAGAPMTEDTVFRIYSMTKPVTGVALMMLFEEGKWRLDDPITKFVPEFSKLQALKTVDKDGNAVTEPLKRPPTMRELMTHTAGFGYGLGGDDPVNKAFRDKAVLRSPGTRALVETVAGIPLLSQPGEAWRYSIAVDIQGYIVERLSGQPLDVFMNERIFKPLGMKDTAFQAKADQVQRLAGLYAAAPGRQALTELPIGGGVQDFTAPPVLLSGGGGLISTAGDYARFCQMLLNGGELDGVRVLSPSTVALMTADHLQPGQGVTANGQGGGTGFAPGVGFGLGLAVVKDPVVAGQLVGEGTVSWGGAAGTWFWADPKNDLFFIGMIQRFSGSEPLGLSEVSRALVYQALTDPGR